MSASVKGKQKKLTSFFNQPIANKCIVKKAPSNNNVNVSKNERLRQILDNLQSQATSVQEPNQQTSTTQSSNTLKRENPYYAPILDKITIQRKTEHERYISETKKYKTGEQIKAVNGSALSHFHGPTFGDHTEGKRSWKGYYEHRTLKMEQQFKKEQRSIYGDLSSNGVSFTKNKKRNRNEMDDSKLNEAKRRKMNESNVGEAEHSNIGPISRIFEGVTVYFNGRTENLSSFHLNKVLIMNGGNFSVHPNSKVTHIITTNLSRSKINRTLDKMGKFRSHHVHYVNSEWITDSIKYGMKMKEDKYLVFHTKKHGDITSFLSTKTKTAEP